MDDLYENRVFLVPKSLCQRESESLEAELPWHGRPPMSGPGTSEQRLIGGGKSGLRDASVLVKIVVTHINHQKSTSIQRGKTKHSCVPSSGNGHMNNFWQ